MSEMDKDLMLSEKKQTKKKTSNKTEDDKKKQNQSDKQITTKTTSSNYTKKRTRRRKKTSKEKKAHIKTTKKHRIKNKNKKNFKIIIVIILMLLLIGLLIFGYKIHYNKKTKEQEQQKQTEIGSHYNEFVITNKETFIYKLENNQYVTSGKIGKNQELTLEEKEITFKDEYFKIKNLDGEYYINYKDVNITEKLSEQDFRYKKYLPYNKNIITKETTSFYDSNNELVYTFNESFSLPIIINKKDNYGVEYNNQLLYVKKEDVKEVIDKYNTNLKNTSGIAVLNYHFFYDETKTSERNDCNQIICHSKSGVRKHFEYIKNNNIFTPTMKEFEMYLNKEINLPKSVLITIDDGWRTEIGKELLEEYQLNGTIFLITSWFKEINWLNYSEYIEYHSHGDNLHNQGICPGGQGGGIKCLNKTKLLEDLALSRKKLAGSTAFCYPFYEYNS